MARLKWWPFRRPARKRRAAATVATWRPAPVPTVRPERLPIPAEQYDYRHVDQAADDRYTGAHRAEQQRRRVNYRYSPLEPQTRARLAPTHWSDESRELRTHGRGDTTSIDAEVVQAVTARRLPDVAEDMRLWQRGYAAVLTTLEGRRYCRSCRVEERGQHLVSCQWAGTVRGLDGVSVRRARQRADR